MMAVFVGHRHSMRTPASWRPSNLAAAAGAVPGHCQGATAGRRKVFVACASVEVRELLAMSLK